MEKFSGMEKEPRRRAFVGRASTRICEPAERNLVQIRNELGEEKKAKRVTRSKTSNSFSQSKTRWGDMGH